MMEIISVKRPVGTPSQVLIGDALPALESLLPKARVIVITDRNLLHHYRELVESYEYIIVGQGEQNKTLPTVQDIYTRLMEMGADRECYILGIGGGIVTDIAGFAASTYMRGLRFGFIATSLLAQVDASVGGKNGVNFEGFKNMIGVFNQPDFVICDASMLATLPEREFRAGMAEMIKSAIVGDPELFRLLESHTFEELRTDRALLTRAITAAAKVKASIVDADEREAGERKKLNLGHTFAHAIEKESVRYIHGEAVAIGTAIIAQLSEQIAGLVPGEYARIISVFEKMGLPTLSPIDPPKLLPAVRADKKRDSEAINMVLVRGIGDCEVRKMPFAELEGIL